MEATYLVECFWPGVTREAVEAANGRAHACAAARRLGGTSLRFLGSLLVPHDEVVFFQFAAACADDVALVSREAALPFDRITESVWLDAEEMPCTPP